MRNELIDYDRVELINTWEHSGFSVWAGHPIDEEEALRFIARYIDRAPLSLQKLSIDDALVSYTSDDAITSNFEPLDFLARLQAHIPDKWESTTRYYGVYSHRFRGNEKKDAAARMTFSTETPIQIIKESPARASRTWAACMKKIFEVDPLLCPRCNAQMKIIAFITDPHEISKISKSLGIKPFLAPDAIRAPPEVDEIPVDLLFHEP